MRGLRAIALALLLLTLCDVAAHGATLQHRRVYLTHPTPHRLALHWGRTLVGRWYVRCNPARPRVLRAWVERDTIGGVTYRTDMVALWYCGREHTKGWQLP